jgi:chemotaxis protein methyltransferase CheR
MERWGDLTRALVRAAPELGFEGPHFLAEWLLQSPFQDSRIDALISYLTIGETHFFRDEKLFQVLESEILPALVASRAVAGRHIGVWSAGCATGDEPYSVAIVLSRLIADLTSWSLTIKATDVNRQFLQKARTGVYSKWSFRSVPPIVIDRYFTQDGESFELLPDIRRMVTFDYLNLARDPYPLAANDTHPMDLIFCRNVLMYFTESCQQHVVQRLCDSLTEGGWLIVTPAEASAITDPRLVQENRGGAILFRKGANKPCADSGAWYKLESKEPAYQSSDNESYFTPTRAERIEPQEAAYAPPPPPESDTEPVCEGKGAPYRQALQVYEVGQYADAVDCLRQILADPALDLGERCASMTLLSKAYANLGRLEEALQWSEKTVATDKLNPRSHYFHGSILQEQGRLQEAVSSMGKALFLDPRLIVAHFALGNLLRQLGKQKESERHFRAALVILHKYGENDLVPASDGLTAGRLTDIIVSTTQKEGQNGKR